MLEEDRRLLYFLGIPEELLKVDRDEGIRSNLAHQPLLLDRVDEGEIEPDETM